MADPKQSGNRPAPNPMFLKQHGHKLLDLGYAIHPVRFKKKGIFDDGWQSVRATSNTLDVWLSNGHAASGVSILTYKTPAVDIDCTDPALVEEAVQIVQDVLFEFGDFPVVRQGKAPKLAIICRTAKPFAKRKTHVFRDSDDVLHHVEILGDGQQLVAYNVHPETDKPYSYLTGELVSTPVEDLPEIDEASATEIINRVNQRFLELGLTIYQRISSASEDDEWGDDADARALSNLAEAGEVSKKITWDQITSALEQTRGTGIADTYETWVAVGMGMYHWASNQRDNTDEWLEQALEAWDDWSSSSDAYDENAIARHWPSFEASLERKAVTVRTLLSYASEQKKKEAIDLASDLKDMIEKAPDQVTLRNKTCKEVARHSGDLSKVDRDALADSYWKKLKQFGITATKKASRSELFPPMQMASGAASVVAANHPWVDGWYWSSERDIYHHVQLGAATEKTFRKRYTARLRQEFLSGLCNKSDYGLGSEDDSLQRTYGDPVRLCDSFELVPIVRAVIYAPGQSNLIVDPRAPEVKDLNSFRPWYAPDEHGINRGTDRVDTDPESWTPKQRAAVARFKELMMINAGGVGFETEAGLLTSFFAYRVQFPERRIQWAPFLFGPKGCGKSTIKDYVTRLYGISHVTEISPEELESSFSAWAGRALFAFVDEIHTEGRAAREHVATRVRTHITGEMVIRICKGRDGIHVPNYQSYIFISNDPNGLPMDEGERRYLVLESMFKTREEAKAALVDSGFREKIGRDMVDEDCLAAVRGYLQTVELHPEFDPASTKDTAAKDKSILASKSALALLIESLIEDEKIWWANKEWVCLTMLMEHVTEGVAAGLYPELTDVKRFAAQYYAKILASEPLAYSNSYRVRNRNGSHRRPTIRTRRPWNEAELSALFNDLAAAADEDDEWS